MRSCLIVVLGLAIGSSAFGEEENWIKGRVVDDSSRPVAGVDVATYWSSNGTQRGPEGRSLDLSKPDELAQFWGHLGRMEPISDNKVVTGPDGGFAIKASWRTHFAMAMDRERKRGGIGVVRKGHDGEPVEIRLAPLIRVRGQIEGASPGTKPAWTHLYTRLPDDPERPAGFFRVAGCGSFDSRFEMSLPPGSYVFHAYGEGSEGEVLPWPTVKLSADKPDVDLGVLTLTKRVGFGERIAQLKAAGSWGDLTQHYGRRPPRIFAQDSRGVPRSFQPWDMPGKWVLIEFWGLDCAPCLGKSLPKLREFREKYASKLDRFEIVTVFIDVDEKIKTMADLDKGLKPVVEHLWGGKALPFPILLDSGFQTWESYGLPGLGTMILIDPEGNLVKGDLEALEAALSKP